MGFRDVFKIIISSTEVSPAKLCVKILLIIKYRIYLQPFPSCLLLLFGSVLTISMLVNGISSSPWPELVKFTT